MILVLLAPALAGTVTNRNDSDTGSLRAVLAAAQPNEIITFSTASNAFPVGTISSIPIASQLNVPVAGVQIQGDGRVRSPASRAWSPAPGSTSPARTRS